MELRVLRYFLTVAKEENISKAADFLHITQPTLSRQLMELEEELGKKLFIRGNRRIILTEDGMLLRRRAEEITALVYKTEAEFHDCGEAISGDIYIGGAETYAMGLLAHAAKELQNEYPRIKFHIYSGNAQDVTERLEKGLIDFCLLAGLADLTKYEFIELPIVNTWGVLMRRDSPLAEKKLISPEDLWNLPLIGSIQSLQSTEISNWIGKDVTKLNFTATYNLVYNASLLVQEGLGYALTLDRLINTSGNSQLCFRPLTPTLEAKLYIVWKKQPVFSKAAELFLNRLKDNLCS